MRRFAFLAALAALLAACGQQAPPAGQASRPAPTIAPFFGGAERPVPTFEIPTPEPRPTVVAEEGSQSILDATARPASSGDQLEEVTIYDEGLAPGWTLANSWDQRINPESRVFASSGFVSVEATPLAPFAGVFFASTPTSRAIYPRAEVVGVRFSVSGGTRHLAPYNLIFKLIGSNRYPYFVPGDDSVRWPPGVQTSKPVFDERGLDGFGLRRDLDPGEWAEVEVRFDGYDQVEYEYVTGIVLMNDPNYMHSFYIDKVSLLFRQP
jgi:hypothetical protein